MPIKIIFLALLLASCGLTPYKMDIHQGNVITAEMRDKLKLGMTKQQVRYVLGTPLISDIFHGNRWDYVYRHEHGGKVIEKQSLKLEFAGDKLQRIDDGPQLAQTEGATADSVSPMVVPVSPPPLVEVKSVKEAVVSSSVDTATADIERAVLAWAKAWSFGDVAQYLANYSNNFKPNGKSKAAWQAQRKERLGKSKSIAVTLSEVDIKLRDASHASATFLQDYVADLHQDKAHKLLQLEKIDGAWLIVSEQTVKQRK